MDEQARALLIVGALLSGASSTAGFVGGRMSAPEPEVRFIHIPVPAISLPADVATVPDAAATVEPQAPASASVAAQDPPIAETKVETKPVPRPRPKVENRPKPEKKRPAVTTRPARSMPSCAAIKREYDAMSWPERMAAYRKATPEEVAHGKRCLGF